MTRSAGGGSGHHPGRDRATDSDPEVAAEIANTTAAVIPIYDPSKRLVPVHDQQPGAAARDILEPQPAARHRGRGAARGDPGGLRRAPARAAGRGGRRAHEVEELADAPVLAQMSQPRTPRRCRRSTRDDRGRRLPSAQDRARGRGEQRPGDARRRDRRPTRRCPRVARSQPRGLAGQRRPAGPPRRWPRRREDGRQWPPARDGAGRTTLVGDDLDSALSPGPVPGLTVLPAGQWGGSPPTPCSRPGSRT